MYLYFYIYKCIDFYLIYYGFSLEFTNVNYDGIFVFIFDSLGCSLQQDQQT